MAEDVVLSLEQLVKTFRVGFQRKRVEAVKGLSFKVRRGEVFGFLGPNGAGKTTTIKMCMDLIRPTSGGARLFGRAPSDLEARKRIGYLPEHPYFYDSLRPDELLDFFGKLYGIPKAVRRKRTDELIELVGLGGARDRVLRKYSKGMVQRFGIAQALISDPELVVLDEPLTGLDPIGRKEIKEIIVSLHKQGKTLFFSSHILSDVELLCDRIAMIQGGRLLYEGPTAELLKRGKRTVEVVAMGAGPAVIDRLRAEGREVEVLGPRLKVQCSEVESSEVVRALVDAGVTLESVGAHSETLEEIFVRAAQRGEAL